MMFTLALAHGVFSIIQFLGCENHE